MIIYPEKHSVYYQLYKNKIQNTFVMAFHGSKKIAMGQHSMCVNQVYQSCFDLQGRSLTRNLSSAHLAALTA